MSRRHTLLNDSGPSARVVGFVFLLLIGAVGFIRWRAPRGEFIREWSEKQIRQMAREECRAVLDGGW